MLRLLNRSESSRIQPVFDACVDYALMQDGRPFNESAAELEFDELPAGTPRSAKRIFAIDSMPGQTVGVIEGLCGYPGQKVWYLGLMLVVPHARSLGVGCAALRELEDYVKSVDGCEELQLAVLKENASGLRFWIRHGFAHLREAPAATFGDRIHERWVLSKRLRAT